MKESLIVYIARITTQELQILTFLTPIGLGRLQIPLQ
jgi:hypothetical protein